MSSAAKDLDMRITLLLVCFIAHSITAVGKIKFGVGGSVIFLRKPSKGMRGSSIAVHRQTPGLRS